MLCAFVSSLQLWLRCVFVFVISFRSFAATAIQNRNTVLGLLHTLSVVCYLFRLPNNSAAIVIVVVAFLPYACILHMLNFHCFVFSFFIVDSAFSVCLCASPSSTR